MCSALIYSQDYYAIAISISTMKNIFNDYILCVYSKLYIDLKTHTCVESV